MTEEIRLEKKKYKLKRHSRGLERKVKTQARSKGRGEEQKLEGLKQEIRKEYPETEFTPKTMRLLRLVGTLPYSSVKRDKRIIAETVSREYL
ncbi:MAG: hypothetical protein HMLIMOIP_000958 [Candidatus Nitrosomirales archaeon]|jgi:hypothetical protein